MNQVNGLVKKHQTKEQDNRDYSFFVIEPENTIPILKNIHTYEQKLGGIQGILAQGIFPQLLLNTDDSNIIWKDYTSKIGFKLLQV